MKLNKGYSLAELVIVVVFVSALTMIAVPRMNFSIVTAKGAQALAKKIETSLRRTRQLAIADAASNTDGYQLRMNGVSPYTDYDIVNLDTSATVDSHTISSDVSCTNGSVFNFGPMGNLLSGSDSQIDIAGGDDSFTITITSATGMVKCVQN
jgi:Tfp pilus assembly protein FimT